MARSHTHENRLICLLLGLLMCLKKQEKQQNASKPMTEVV